MTRAQYQGIQRRLVALLLACCVALPAGAFAQDDKAKLAQEAFDAGMSHYAEKEYGKAVAEFRKGYKIVPAGMFLYNIALSYTKLGDYEKALRYAKRADEKTDLPQEVRARNSARIDALSIRRTTVALASTMQPAQKQSDLFAGGGQKDKKGPKDASSSGPGMLTYAGAGTAVVGLALVGGALYIGSDLDGRIDKLGQVDDRAQYDQMRSEIESDRTVGQILLFSGVGLTAVGAGLVGWDLYAGGEQGALTIRPTLGATTGAEVEWRF